MDSVGAFSASSAFLFSEAGEDFEGALKQAAIVFDRMFIYPQGTGAGIEGVPWTSGAEWLANVFGLTGTSAERRLTCDDLKAFHALFIEPRDIVDDEESFYRSVDLVDVWGSADGQAALEWV